MKKGKLLCLLQVRAPIFLFLLKKNASFSQQIYFMDCWLDCCNVQNILAKSLEVLEKNSSRYVVPTYVDVIEIIEGM